MSSQLSPFITSALLVMGTLFSGCASTSHVAPLKTVPFVDLERYSGRWYVIANIPYFLERGKVASYETYERRPDGRLTNNFTFRRKSFDAPEVTWHGTAKITNPVTNAEWAVQFIWPLSADYLVIDLDPDYSWAVIGHPSRKLLWVLARDRQMPEDVYQALVQRTASQGYDPALITKVPQPVE